ncbi:MAG TPA: hypothetical protein VM033_06505 [Gemmatimonadaceae bacterium]|nr:hypothetical protein [Gemmatimonadaceae bacterium]
MRHTHFTLAASILTFASASWAGAQQSRASAASPAHPATGMADSVYSSRESDFVVGKRVHLRSTKSFIGRIIGEDASHAFPPDRFPRARMQAVLIERRDGPRGWVPVEGITRIYVVR